MKCKKCKCKLRKKNETNLCACCTQKEDLGIGYIDLMEQIIDSKKYRYLKRRN